MDIRSLFRIDRRRKKLRNGKTVYIKPLNVRDTATMQGLFDPLAAAWVNHGFSSLEVQAAHADALIGIIAVAIGQEESFVEEMDKRDYDEIWKLLLEIEKDFLQGRVLMAAKTITGHLSSEMKIGATSFSS